MAIFLAILITILVVTPLTFVGTHALIGFCLVAYDWYRDMWKKLVKEADPDLD